MPVADIDLETKPCAWVFEITGARRVRAVDVSRTYHVGDIDVHALNNVSVTIERGEFVAIMGLSGSGKSTLMSVFGCLDRPSSGHYFFEGLDVAQLDEPALARVRSERLGFVFQSFNLLARTSAIENVALPLFYTGSGPADAASRTERARALINEPSLLLADEPTGNLDSRASHKIMQTLTTPVAGKMGRAGGHRHCCASQPVRSPEIFASMSPKKPTAGGLLALAEESLGPETDIFYRD